MPLKLAFAAICIAIVAATSAHAQPVPWDEFVTASKDIFDTDVQIQAGENDCSVLAVVDVQSFVRDLPSIRDKVLNSDYSVEWFGHHPYVAIDGFANSFIMFLIIEAYKFQPSFDHCKFYLEANTPDLYGHLGTKNLISFSFTRALFDKIDWEHFRGSNLAKIAPNYEVSDFMENQVENEMGASGNDDNRDDTQSDSDGGQ